MLNMNITTTERPIVIVDALNIFIRHYMVNEEINNKSEPIGGVTGFIKALNSYVNTFSPQKVFVIWESGGPSPRRKKISENYKANRSKLKEFVKYKAGTGNMKDILRLDEETKINQLMILSKLLKTTPICQIFIPETECDDIIAYLIRGKFCNITAKKIILSSDKDFLQLLDDSTVEIFDPGIKSLINGEKVLEKFGISSRNFCLAKALVGDESDNIEGIPGAGWKTVAKRFPELADVEKDLMISDLTEIAKKNYNPKKPIKIYQDIVSCEKLIKRNWDLMYLNIGALSASQINKIDGILEAYEPKMDKLTFIKTLLESGISINLDIDSFCSQMRNFLR
jgi:DNA polymerase-1